SVVGMMRTDAGTDILLRGLEHPRESVRQVAIRALTKHASPSFYERLSSLLPISSPPSQREIATALHACDPQRAEDDFCAWFASRTWPETWPELLACIIASRRPATLEKLRELLPRATGEQALAMRAALAGGGDQAALEELRRMVREGPVEQRAAAAQALDRAG